MKAVESTQQGTATKSVPSTQSLQKLQASALVPGAALAEQPFLSSEFSQAFLGQPGVTVVCSLRSALQHSVSRSVPPTVPSLAHLWVRTGLAVHALDTITCS